MLLKYFTLIFTFLCFLSEHIDLLCFYCRASIVYNIIALILIPNFSSPLSEENPRLREDSVSH